MGGTCAGAFTAGWVTPDSVTVGVDTGVCVDGVTEEEEEDGPAAVGVEGMGIELWLVGCGTLVFT